MNVPESPGEFIIVHVVFVFAEAPEPGHLLGVQQLELALVVGPGDDVLMLVTDE